MLNVMRSFLIVGILASGLQAEANTDAYSVKKSTSVYGKLDSKSKLDGEIVSNLKCGYFLTKGAAFIAWGPSLTFFLEDSSGKRSVLYHMFNGTRNLDPIETLDMQTADERKIDQKKKTYTSIYKRTDGFLKNFIAEEKASLMIERNLNENINYSSQNDTDILRIGYKLEQLKKTQMSYIPTTSLSCSFNKQFAKF
ncbi:MAG: hypothetical protein V4596_02940 [Bdellovibrionota bacterium]